MQSVEPTSVYLLKKVMTSVRIRDYVIVLCLLAMNLLGNSTSVSFPITYRFWEEVLAEGG